MHSVFVGDARVCSRAGVAFGCGVIVGFFHSMERASRSARIEMARGFPVRLFSDHIYAAMATRSGITAFDLAVVLFM